MMRLIPAGTPARRGQGVTAGLSVALHGAALAALLLLGRPPVPQGPVDPAFTLVFEDGGAALIAPDPGGRAPAAPAEPSPALPSDMPAEAPALQGPETPAPQAPPEPDAMPAPQPIAPEPQVQPQVQDQAEPSGPPAVRIEAPPPLPTTTPSVPAFVMPEAPPPLPPPATRHVRPRVRAAPGTFDNPLDLNFGPAPTRQAAPRSGAAPGSVASRALDLSPGAPRAGPSRADAFFDARAQKLGADWMQGVQAYWLRHRYYPRQAGEAGEDGTVDVEITVDRTGRVTAADLVSRSGSRWLDMAAIGTFRGARLPPLPAEVDAPYKVTLNIHYLLLRR